MKVFEIFSQDLEKPELEFDLADDLIFYMQNDPEFYRKEYYPVEHKIEHYLKADRDTAPVMLKGLVKKAYQNYINNFQVTELSDELAVEDLKEICEKLHSMMMQRHREEQNNEEK